MQKYFASFESLLHGVCTNTSREFLAAGAITFIALLSFSVFKIYTKFSRPAKASQPRKGQNRDLPALTSEVTDTGEGQKLSPVPSAAQLFAKELAASASEKGVPLAPLQTILGRLVEGSISENTIPERLLASAGQLAELRARLAAGQIGDRGIEEANAEALAFLDRGNFDAAVMALRRGREAAWTGPADRYREEAELYAQEAMIEHLRVCFRAAAANYGDGAALILESGDKGACPFLIAQARELCEDGRESGSRESLLLAADICHRALGLLSREQSPSDWASAKHCLGHALFLLGSQGNEPDRLKEAVEAYLLALEEWTRGRAPAEWATAQSDLGNALKALGGQTGKHETLRAAAEAYRAALSEMRRQEKTCGWAQTCKSLGDTLAILGIEENEAERLIDAVDAYQDALGWIDRELFPAQWASAQVNLGNALQALAEMEKGSRRLHQAALAYQEVLRDGTLCRTTLAAANDNLGSVLAAVGERENSAAKLREAASAYRAALDACPEDEAPLDAAKTHINLAYTLSALWNRLRQPQALDEALLAADAALRLIEKAGAREEMTEAKLARAAILSAMGKGKMEAA